MTETIMDIARRVPSSVGRPVAVDAVVNAIVTEPSDGATIMATGLPYGGSGIVVALPGHGYVLNARRCRVLAENGFSPRDLVEVWVQNRAQIVTDAQTLRRRAYGVWRHGEEIHLDIVEIFSDEDEDLAVKAGQARNQISVWHAGRGEEIPTAGTGEAIPEDSDDFPDVGPWGCDD